MSAGTWKPPESRLPAGLVAALIEAGLHLEYATPLREFWADDEIEALFILDPDGRDDDA